MTLSSLMNSRPKTHDGLTRRLNKSGLKIAGIITAPNPP